MPMLPPGIHRIILEAELDPAVVEPTEFSVVAVGEAYSGAAPLEFPHSPDVEAEHIVGDEPPPGWSEGDRALARTRHADDACLTLDVSLLDLAEDPNRTSTGRLHDVDLPAPEGADVLLEHLHTVTEAALDLLGGPAADVGGSLHDFSFEECAVVPHPSQERAMYYPGAASVVFKSKSSRATHAGLLSEIDANVPVPSCSREREPRSLRIRGDDSHLLH